MVNIQFPTTEIRREKKEEERSRMVALFHRATIKTNLTVMKRKTLPQQNSPKYIKITIEATEYHYWQKYFST